MSVCLLWKTFGRKSIYCKQRFVNNKKYLILPWCGLWVCVLSSGVKCFQEWMNKLINEWMWIKISNAYYNVTNHFYRQKFSISALVNCYQSIVLSYSQMSRRYPYLFGLIQKIFIQNFFCLNNYWSCAVK